jgi:hypothetical protein
MFHVEPLFAYFGHIIAGLFGQTVSLSLCQAPVDKVNRLGLEGGNVPRGTYFTAF